MAVVVELKSLPLSYANTCLLGPQEGWHEICMKGAQYGGAWHIITKQVLTIIR